MLPFSKSISRVCTVLRVRKYFSSKALLAFNIIVGKVGTNKNEFLTDCKELFVTYSVDVLKNVIMLFTKMGAFVNTSNVCQGPLSLWQKIFHYT